LEEQKLIQLAKGGDKSAFSQLVKMHKNYIYAVIFQILKNKEDAEDVLQNAFIKIYQKLYMFKGDSKFSTWIYRVAVNEALAFKRLFKYKLREKEIPVNEIEKENANKKLHNDDLKSCINTAIEKLTDNEKLVVSLFYLQEQKVKEIAAICKKNNNWVKVVLHRARKKLESILEPHKNLIYD